MKLLVLSMLLTLLIGCTPSHITEEQAKEIIMEKVPGATITKFEMAGDSGIVYYDAEILFEGVMYEISVDVITGSIVKYEVEKREDKDSGLD